VTTIKGTESKTLNSKSIYSEPASALSPPGKGPARKFGGDSTKRWQWLSISAVAAVFAFTWISFWQAGYQLFGDTAVVSVRAFDVFGPGSPLLGMPSAFNSWSNLADPAHPGPLVFWVLAPTARLIGGSNGALLGTFILAMAATVWIVLASVRRVGKLGAPAAAVAVLAAARLGSFTIFEAINPSMAVLPALALCFAVWSVLDGENPTWPWLIGAASFTIQADLSFLPTTTCLVGLAAVITTTRWIKAGGRNPFLLKQPRRIILWSLGVLLVLWALPLGEALANNGGNLLEGWRASRADIAVRGASAVVKSLIFLLLPVVLLSPLILISWCRNLPSRRPLAIAALVAAIGTALGQGLIPAGQVASLTWVPVSVTTVFAIFAAGVIAADIVAGTGPHRMFRLSFTVWTLLAAMTFTTVQYLPHQNPFGSELFPAIETLADAAAALPPGDYRLQPLSGPSGVALSLGIVAETSKSPVRLMVSEPLARYLGANRKETLQEKGSLYVTRGNDSPPVQNAKLITQWSPPEFNAKLRAATDSEVAKAARSLPPIWSDSSSEFFIGSIIAGYGQTTSTHSSAGLSTAEYLDDDAASRIGQIILSGTDSPWSLSDAAISHLVADGLLQLPAGHKHLHDPFTSRHEARVVRMWLAPPVR